MMNPHPLRFAGVGAQWVTRRRATVIVLPQRINASVSMQKDVVRKLNVVYYSKVSDLAGADRQHELMKLTWAAIPRVPQHVARNHGAPAGLKLQIVLHCPLRAATRRAK